MENEQFRQTLDRYLAGKATPEEIAWLESAYINLNRTEPAAQSEEALASATGLMWNVIEQQTRPARRSISWKYVLSAAAVLFILCTIFLLTYRQSFRTSSIADLPENKDIKAGTNQAVLVLSSGKSINLENAPSGKLADEEGAVVSKMADGLLNYQADDAKDEIAAVEYNTIKIPAAGQYQLTLPDGTKVWLNASSSLTFPTGRMAERIVKLEGEAYFEVAKLYRGEQRIPFIVETAKQKIEVLGTHFNVNSYADEPSVKTTLLEGSVRLNDQLLLKPGQQAVTRGDDIKIRDVKAEDFIDWKNGDFILEQDDFRTIMRKIARWYDVEVIYDQDAPKRIVLGGLISRSKNISSILQVMEQTGKVHFTLEGRRVTVTK